jgi:hypothetical protein
MITLDRLDEKTRNRVLAPLQQLTDSMVIEDTGALLEFIDADPAARNGALSDASVTVWADDTLFA